MKKLGICAVCVLTFAFVSTAEAARPLTHGRGKIHRVIAASPGSVTLYDQNNDDAGVAVLSTYFTDDFVMYSSYGADDFSVPEGHRWILKQVEVSGAYLTGGQYPPASENLLFYKDANHLPGRLIAKCENLRGAENFGSFAILLPKSCRPRLKGGRRYWISVFANMDFSTGDWGWETREIQNGEPAAWENPSGIDGSCETWEVMTDCIGDDGEGPDFMFALKGKDTVL